MSAKVKISVLKKIFLEDIAKKYAVDGMSVCKIYQEGQEFITDGRTMPEGFCTWAWADIFKDILFVRNNMECVGTKDEKSMVACCTDGFRPVIFLIEPYEENKAQ
ncbi:MAG: TIGR04076 family protein [Ignavibacteriae bacterium HGW-Ignavibacteriae-4]|jgi:uncharacterized repeat protein (TIGR04076 family)|nr:MAG: TIGR04076 family protein [Ignavibacteriae bacterium HGW-Ignavibacteriae-4]